MAQAITSGDKVFISGKGGTVINSKRSNFAGKMITTYTLKAKRSTYTMDVFDRRPNEGIICRSNGTPIVSGHYEVV